MKILLPKLLPATGLLLLLVFGQCQHTTQPVEPGPAPQQAAGVIQDSGLFYSDTLADNHNPHPSERALFERAKMRAIGSYYSLKHFPSPKDDSAEGPGTNRTSDGKYFEYPTWGAYRAAVQHDLDSLRAIEKKLLSSSTKKDR